MIAYTVSTHFGHRLEGIFYDKDEAYHYKLFVIRQHYALEGVSDEDVLEKNREYDFASIREILDSY